MISVLIVDDQPLQRLGFRMLLESTPDMLILDEADGGSEAVRLAALLVPDVVLMDIRMPGLDGIEATRAIVATGGRTRVLVMTTFDLDEYTFAALRAGASGFLLKDAKPDELLTAIRSLAAGDAVVAPGPTRRLLDVFAGRVSLPEPTTDTDPRLAKLTDREREVLTAIGLGWNNTEIAHRLVLAESTVKTHVGHILAKLEARDRIHAVIVAYEAGLVGR